MPVIAVTPRERRAGLLGQLRGDRDDYLLRPFAVDELAARIRLRLRLGPVGGTTMLRHGERGRRHRVRRGDRRRPAGRAVADGVLPAARAGRRGGSGRACRTGWPGEAWSEPVSANLVQVYISYLRRKIGPERIRTVRGGGYVLEA